MLKTTLEILSFCCFCFGCSMVGNKNMQNNESLLGIQSDYKNVTLQVCNSRDSLKNDDKNDDDSNECIKYVLKKKNELIEYEVDKKAIDPSLKRYFATGDRKKNDIRERVEKLYGKDNIRAHWDLEFRQKHCKNAESQTTAIIKNNEIETLTLKRGGLQIKDWLRIENQDTIQNLDPSYLDKSENWPRTYIKVLKYNKCKRLGLLLPSKICGASLCTGSIGLEIFFIVQAIVDKGNIDFVLTAVYWGSYGMLFSGMGSLLLFDPYLLKTEKFCRKNKNEEYQINIEEPSECRKAICCMEPKKDSIPGAYRCFGCFSYPDCLLSCFDGISECFDKIGVCLMKVMCCSYNVPKEIVLTVKKDKILNEEYTVDLKVGESDSANI